MYLYTHLISFDSVLYKSHTTPLPSIVLISCWYIHSSSTAHSDFSSTTEEKAQPCCPDCILSSHQRKILALLHAVFYCMSRWWNPSKGMCSAFASSEIFLKLEVKNKVKSLPPFSNTVWYFHCLLSWEAFQWDTGRCSAWRKVQASGCTETLLYTQ